MSSSARFARWRRSRGDRRATLLVLGGLTLFVGVTYVIVVLGGGALIGHTDSPHLGLSLLATAVVALGFEPVQARLERRATRAVHGGRPSPYDVLSRFAEAVTGPSGDEVPVRMARVLAEGTGARWAQVWLSVEDGLVLAATWPAEAAGDDQPPGVVLQPGRRTRTVRLAGEVLGVLRLREQAGRPLTPVEERLFAGLAAQAGVVLHGVRLRAQLAQRALQLSARAEELRASRERLVETQDAARRRLERDIHDSAQQHLVALAVNLRLAETLAGRSPERARQVLVAQADAARVATDTLVQLARGIYPRRLGDDGIGPALRTAVATSPVPVTVDDGGLGRHPREVEAAVYFCCLEAVQNAVKHAGATHVVVSLRDGDGEGDGTLEFTVTDDGRGFDPRAAATSGGLANMRDRVDSLGGRLDWAPASGGGTRVSGLVPAVIMQFPGGAGTEAV
jgi:signal transduction histidine kinase